jgi:hypothetical protein
MLVDDSAFTVIERFGEVVKDRLYGRELSKFSKTGKCIEKDLINPDGSLEWKVKYTYDAIGNLIEVNEYRANGKLYLKTSIHYIDGYLIKENFYDSAGVTTGFATYRYDESLKIKKMSKYILIQQFDEMSLDNMTHFFNDVVKPEGHFETLADFKDFISDSLQADFFFNEVVKPEGHFETLTDFKSFCGLSSSNKKPQLSLSRLLNSNGKIMLDSNFINGCIDVAAKYVYDIQDALVGINIYDKIGKQYSSEKYSYEYDNFGNWITRLNFVDNKPCTITTRKIKYY